MRLKLGAAAPRAIGTNPPLDSVVSRNPARVFRGRCAAHGRCGGQQPRRRCWHDRVPGHRPGAGRPQDLRRGPSARRSSARDRPLAGSRRDGRDHGPERLREDDAAQLPLRTRRDRRGRDPDRGRRTLGDVGPAAHRLPRAPDGLRLPVLQPDAGPDGGGERRAARCWSPASQPPRLAAARSRRSSSSGSRTARATFRRSSRAASASASRSPARS